MQRHRLLVPPGVTGLWQIFGSARIPLNEMVKIDYLYGANWSLWLDIKILLQDGPVRARAAGTLRARDALDARKPALGLQFLRT